jgi:hypothetical protein
MQELRASAGARLAPLDLRQEEREPQDIVRGGEQRRQAADMLHYGVEIEQGVAPILATRNRPLVGLQLAGFERGAEWLDPARRDEAAQQKKAVLIKAPGAFGVEPADLRMPQQIAHSSLYLPAGVSPRAMRRNRAAKPLMILERKKKILERKKKDRLAAVLLNWHQKEMKCQAVVRAVAEAFCFLRRESQPITPRPVAKSGNAAGSGVAAGEN